MQITEKSLQAALMAWAMNEKHHVLVLPNSRDLFYWEADLVTVTKAGLTHEYEIKCSLSDYRRDALKIVRHRSIKSSRGACYFWYVTHGFEIEPPEHAGWLSVSLVKGRLSIVERRAAPRFDGRRIVAKDYEYFARLLSWRLTNHYRRYAQGGD